MVRMMGRWGCVLAAALPLLATGCASSLLDPLSAPRATPQAKAEAQKSYDDCLKGAAHYADDGKKSPSHLALIVAPMCYEPFLKLEKIVSAGLSGSARRQYEQSADAGQVDFAMTAIRTERSAGGEKLAAGGPGL